MHMENDLAYVGVQHKNYQEKNDSDLWKLQNAKTFSFKPYQLQQAQL